MEGNRIVNLGEYTRLDRPQAKWLIPGVLPRPGLTVLMGPPFSGKSFFSLQLAISLASQQTMFDHTPTEPVRVFYVQLDTSELIWKDRLQSLHRDGVSLDIPVYMGHPDVVRPPMLITDGAVQRVLLDLLTAINPDVVIIDVLRELHQFDENDSTSQKKVFDAIQSVFGSYSLLLLHHSKKVYGDIDDVDPISLCRGSSFIPGRADALWLLAQGKLKMTSRYSEPKTYHLEQQANGLFAISSEREYNAPSTTDDPAIAIVVQTHLQKPDGLSHSQHYTNLQADLSAAGISRSKYFRVLHSLKLLPAPNQQPSE